jgi:hypothetical protein
MTETTTRDRRDGAAPRSLAELPASYVWDDGEDGEEDAGKVF